MKTQKSVEEVFICVSFVASESLLTTLFFLGFSYPSCRLQLCF